MQVFELADDLRVDTEALIALLRQMGIPVTDEDATITDGQMAKVLAKVGPVKARFETQITLSDLVPPASYTLTGEGKGGAAGFARGSAEVSLEEDGEATVLRYVARIQPGGKLAQVGSRLIGGTARKLGEQFFSRFAEVLVPDPES